MDLKPKSSPSRYHRKHKTKAPLFSVIILTYMQRHLIDQALDSILSQTYPNLELVICDDCSADFDEKHLQEYILEHKKNNLKNVVIYQQPENMGTTLNAKKGVELSHGVYFKLHAGDDMLYGETVLDRMAQHFKDPEINIIAARSVACTYDGQMTNDYYPAFGAMARMEKADAEGQFVLMSTQAWGEFINAPAVFWRRSLYERVGGFDLDYRYTEDWPMWLKITKQGYRITPINDATTIYRYGGISNNSGPVNRVLGCDHYRECIKMLDKYGMNTLQQKWEKRRCSCAKKAIEARIVLESKWDNMCIMEKLDWKCRHIGFLLNSWLYRHVACGVPSGVAIRLKWTALFLIMFMFGAEVLPGIKGEFFWALCFCIGLGCIIVQRIKVAYLRWSIAKIKKDEGL